MHVPIIWWHCFVSKQCPQSVLQFSPYVPTSQAVNHFETWVIPLWLWTMHSMTLIIQYTYIMSSKSCGFSISWWNFAHYMISNSFDANGKIYYLKFFLNHFDAKLNKKQKKESNTFRTIWWLISRFASFSANSSNMVACWLIEAMSTTVITLLTKITGQTF